MDCRELVSAFVCCLEEERYEKRLLVLLSDLRRPCTVLVIVATVFCLQEDLGKLYFIANRL